MKSTFWMTAQEAEDEIHRRETLSRHIVNTQHEPRYTACVMIDAYQYLLGEYHMAASHGEGLRRESIMDALRIIDKAERSIPFYSTFQA